MAQPRAEHMSNDALRVGVDLVRVADVASSIARFGDRYIDRVFTSDERAYCGDSESRAAERYAARFAAKEATIKALRPTAGDGIDWRSIEVRRMEAGECEIELHNGALALAKRTRVRDLSLSMSHEREFATATVIARLDRSAAPNRSALTVVHAGSRRGTRRGYTSRDG